ncbi:MAG: alpha/beta hydrolase [Agarilytica sp.]
MPSLNSDRGLTLDTIHRIEADLPIFDATSFLADDAVGEDLACYFETYGFNRLENRAQYSLGYVVLDNYEDVKGYRVATHYWFRENAGATVFVAHGLFDHVGLYLDLIDRLLAEGYSVIAIDFPGHGLSEGEPAAIGDFAEYAHVISGVLDAFPNSLQTPIYAIGQSTGCAAILNYVLAARGKAFQKLVLLAPLIQPRSWHWVNLSYCLLNLFVSSVSRNFTVNSHREDFHEFLSRHDPLQCRGISVDWVGAMRKWVKHFDSFGAVSIDTLVVQGDADGTVWWERNVPRIQNKITGCQVEMIEGAMHHLVKEGDAWQSQVFSKALGFLKK